MRDGGRGSHHRKRDGRRDGGMTFQGEFSRVFDLAERSDLPHQSRSTGSRCSITPCLRVAARANRIVRKPPAFVDAGDTDDVVLAVAQGRNSCAHERCALCLAHHASGEEPSPLSNGLSLVQARPSTINPQGVRYASVRPLRLRLRGDRSRPRTLRRLSSGDGPRHKTGASRCRTISPSHRITPSIWPAR